MIGETLAALALVAVAVSFGSYLNGLVVLLPAQRRLSAGAYVESQQANTALGTVRYRVLLGTTVVLLVVAALTATSVVAAVLAATSATVVAGSTAVITVRRVVPINLAVRRWDVADPPSNWSTVRDQWHRLHLVRTAWLGLALVLQLTGLVVGSVR